MRGGRRLAGSGRGPADEEGARVMGHTDPLLIAFLALLADEEGEINLKTARDGVVPSLVPPVTLGVHWSRVSRCGRRPAAAE
jgi:hypothetical protein